MLDAAKRKRVQKCQRKGSRADLQVKKRSLCGQRSNGRNTWMLNHKQSKNLIMKPPLHLESNGDLLLSITEGFISLNNHPGGMENGFKGEVEDKLGGWVFCQESVLKYR